jgi:hypothetical protein
MQNQGLGLLVSALLCVLGFYPPLAAAADPKGYTAEYECRAGNPNCNVDVVALTAPAQQPCEQTITTSTAPTGDWSAINWSNNVICIQAGDHTGRGTLTIQASGTPGARKVLRYTRATDNDDEPWNQSTTTQAKVRDLVLNGASYWLVHRLTFPASSAGPTPGDYRVELVGLATDNIFSRLLVEGNSSVPSESNQLYGGIGSTTPFSHRTTIQNSVIRTNYSAGTGFNCVGTPPLGDDVRVVNNEIYDWCEHNYQQGENGTPILGGSVIENNDVYYNNPTFTGHAEANVVFKATGTSGNPQRVIHNRIWGTRWATTCCDGGGGDGIFIAGQDAAPFNTVDYVLIQNNIIFDNIYGVSGYPGNGTHHSIVGNLLYNHHQFNGSNNDSAAFSLWGVGGSSEFYLNTVVDSDRYFDFQGANNQDLRCDVAISAGPSVPTMGGSSQIDDDVYYGTPDNGEANKISKTLNTRANSTAYSAGTIIRTAAISNCVTASDTACFLYKVTASGTSAATPPTYCHELGCTTTDGSMTVQAVRGPYVFKRKLKTGPEDFVIPYATVHTSADEATDFCPTTTGNRAGIGINDDPLGSGILAKDLTGANRGQTAGALQASAGTGGGGGGGGGGTQTPYPGPNAAAIPGKIEVENYDQGGEGIAYHDTSPTNEPGAYRTDAVDVEVTQDAGGGHDVGWITPGEWLEYTVNVATAGMYDIEIRSAAQGPGGSMHIEFNGVDKTGAIVLPDTGDWQAWQTTTKTGVSLSAGQQVMRLAFDVGNNGWLANINYVRITQAGSNPVGTPYPGPNAAAIPGTIELENYDQGGEGVAYHDLSPTNEPGAYRNDAVDVEVTADPATPGGYDVGWIKPGEWLTYSVNVETAGTYDIEVRSAAQGPGGTMHIEFNGTPVTGAITLPDTGDWQAWQTTTVPRVTLSAGQQLMKLVFDNGNDGWLANINYVRFVRR